MSEQQFLSVSEVATLTGKSAATIARLARNGKIPGAVQSSVKTGTGAAWLIPAASVSSIPRRKRGRPFAVKAEA